MMPLVVEEVRVVFCCFASFSRTRFRQAPRRSYLAPWRLQSVHKILCTATQGPAGKVSAQGWQHHRCIAGSARLDFSQPIHQTLESSLLLVVIAIADAGAARVSPDLGSHEQK